MSAGCMLGPSVRRAGLSIFEQLAVLAVVVPILMFGGR